MRAPLAGRCFHRAGELPGERCHQLHTEGAGFVQAIAGGKAGAVVLHAEAVAAGLFARLTVNTPGRPPAWACLDELETSSLIISPSETAVSTEIGQSQNVDRERDRGAGAMIPGLKLTASGPALRLRRRMAKKPPVISSVRISAIASGLRRSALRPGSPIAGQDIHAHHQQGLAAARL